MRTNLYALTVLWLSLFTAMLGIGVIMPLMPIYAEQMGASGFLLGLIFAAFSIARVIFMPLFGKLSDRYGRKPFIVIGLAIQVVSAVAFYFSLQPYHLLFTRFFQGLAGALVLPIAMALVGEISPRDRESAYLGYFSVALYVGFGSGPLLGGLISDHWSIQVNFVMLGLFCLAAFLGVLFFLPANHQPTNPRSRIVLPYRVLLRNRVISGMSFYSTVNSFSRGVLSVFLPLFGQTDLGLSLSQVGILLSANLLTTAMWQPLFGRLADRFNRRALVVFGSLLQGVAMCAMMLADNFMQAMSLNILMGLAGAVSLPAAGGMVVTEGKNGGMGGAMALFNMGMSLGLAIGPILGGIVFDLTGFRGAFIFGGLASMLGAAPVLFLVKKNIPDAPNVPTGEGEF